MSASERGLLCERFAPQNRVHSTTEIFGQLARSIIKRSRVDKLACQRVSADCSASAPKTEQSTKCRRLSGEARKEYKYPIPFRRVSYEDVCHSAGGLAVLDYTPTGASALCALGATHCVCLTANRRGAICGICPREQAPGYKLP